MQAANRMLAAFNPADEQELTLAAEIVLFSFKAMAAQSQSAAADLAFAKMMQLRSSVVQMHRQSHSSRKALADLQRARRAGQPALSPRPVSAEPAPKPPAPPTAKPVANPAAAKPPAFKPSVPAKPLPTPLPARPSYTPAAHTPP